MRNLKLKISYDGSRYNGFQGQKNTENTIQEVLEKNLSAVLGEEVDIIASGRTDAGVHAYGQVVNFKCRDRRSTKDLIELFNKKLPSSISVNSVEEVNKDFHARFDAKDKTYVYRVLNTKSPSPFTKKYTYFYPKDMDMEKMMKAAEIFVGKHDFRAFSSGKSKKSTVRTINSIKFEAKDGEVQIIFNGNGFLYNMVRIITGTLLEVNEGKLKLSDVKNALTSEERQFSGFTAPAWGLFLKDVNY